MKTILKFAFIAIFSTLIIGCSSDDDPAAKVTILNQNTDFDGDVTGSGGSLNKSYTWNNPLATVDYNMDITSAQGGSFQLIMQDADGAVVLDKTIVAGQGEDSRSGVSQAGTPGDWTVQIILKNFNGDGSFSISPGN